MTVRSAMKRYRETLKKIKAYGYAGNAIYYDAMTAAPERSQEARGPVMAFLSEEEYKLSTGKAMREAVSYLYEHREELKPEEKREIELYNKDMLYMSSIPKEEYIEYSLLINDAEAVWHKAKAENDFAAFCPYLERIFDAKRRFALYYKPEDKPYDTCLSQYETGLTEEKADAFFAALRERIVPLIKKIGEKEQIDDSFLYKTYPIELQRKFSDKLLEIMSIDRKRCAIGETEHPFTMEFSKNDVRVTTHYYENNLASSLYSVVHEGGHALYELGGGDEYEGTALSGGVSMGIHESQSRLFENIIGRSRAFVSVIYPVLLELFPQQLEGVSEEMLYRAVNKSTPSLIRTEADELTYSLHVMVRYEIEKGVIGGKYKVSDLPKIWAEKMKEYLGVDVPSDSEGVLQDSHWSGGGVGYFPSYALGSAYGVMFTEEMKKELDVDDIIRKGDLAPIVAWLTDKIYRHSSRYEPNELIESVCGKEFDPMPYVDYLEKKYTELYNL